MQWRNAVSFTWDLKEKKIFCSDISIFICIKMDTVIQKIFITVSILYLILIVSFLI